MSNERAAKIARILRERIGARARTAAARITDMANFVTGGWLFADMGGTTIKVVCRTLDCLQIGDYIWVRKMEQDRWSDYLYDGFNYRLRPDGSTDYYPGLCEALKVIVLWSGSVADIPDDFVLCDGRENGAPDLRGMFVLGDGGDDIGGGYLGGSPATVAHGHDFHTEFPFAGGHTEGEIGHVHLTYLGESLEVVGAAGETLGLPLTTGGNHTHPFTGTQVATYGAHDHWLADAHSATVAYDPRPPFYALCYIMSREPKIVPLGGIVLTNVALETLPANYRVVADLVGRFPVGVGTYAADETTATPPWWPNGSVTINHTHTVGTMAVVTARHYHDAGDSEEGRFTIESGPEDSHYLIFEGGLGNDVMDPHTHFLDPYTGLGGDHDHTIDPTIATLPIPDLTFRLTPPTIKLMYVKRIA